jgi:hypothetical protein
VKRVVQLIERAVILPAAKIVVQRAAWRQVFWDGAPLAAGAQHINQPIHHRALIHTALVAASLGAPDLRPDRRPFIVGQVARIAQPAAVITGAVLDSPHARLLQIGDAAREAQRISRLLKNPY